ncbi:hypothetical protein [Spartinivicinus ruber]|uniref:hypothetical protein n=1 Tax=Spartinivicinus ruber TaxID=2683272 RepID=UPI0013D14DEA|nr:hypothetical protein [Spartinivicinus ruber]
MNYIDVEQVARLLAEEKITFIEFIEISQEANLNTEQIQKIILLQRQYYYKQAIESLNKIRSSIENQLVYDQEIKSYDFFKDMDEFGDDEEFYNRENIEKIINSFYEREGVYPTAKQILFGLLEMMKKTAQNKFLPYKVN